MVNKWEIYFCNLDPTQGSEQRGTRPVLIISTDSVNHNLTVSTVLQLSGIKGNEKIYPTEILLPADITGLPKLSVAMLQQIRTISHSRLINKAGMITDSETKAKILEACREYFDIRNKRRTESHRTWLAGPLFCYEHIQVNSIFP